ncbi:hypothetical protein GCM10007216_27810 [Thalassobacillus devorans]|uniref:Uncharacterized protein n=1 Tax=Thalassobacillus devorans TaxID=279813 RepID=A0ABQ1PED2_9BACI|nr:hypothetical protein [Thalassobacillus devorans]GGC95497.1 hypothetical protein GCM10007216_27810 [Thalassobacillus devorans]
MRPAQITALLIVIILIGILSTLLPDFKLTIGWPEILIFFFFLIHILFGQMTMKEVKKYVILLPVLLVASHVIIGWML